MNSSLFRRFIYYLIDNIIEFRIYFIKYEFIAIKLLVESDLLISNKNYI